MRLSAHFSKYAARFMCVSLLVLSAREMVKLQNKGFGKGKKTKRGSKMALKKIGFGASISPDGVWGFWHKILPICGFLQPPAIDQKNNKLKKFICYLSVKNLAAACMFLNFNRKISVANLLLN